MPSPVPAEQHPEIAKLKRGDVILFRGRTRIVISTYRNSITVVRASHVRQANRIASCSYASIVPSVAEREAGIVVVAEGARIPKCPCGVHAINGYKCARGE